MALVKSILVAVYQRVILSYKSTLVGLALAAGVEVVNQLQAAPSNALHAVAFVLGAVLAFLKSPALAANNPPPPAA